MLIWLSYDKFCKELFWLTFGALALHRSIKTGSRGESLKRQSRTLKPSLNKDGDRYHLPRDWDNLLSHTCTKHMTSAQIITEEADWVMGEGFEVCFRLHVQ